jgi:hypothetical protein
MLGHASEEKSIRPDLTGRPELTAGRGQVGL